MLAIHHKTTREQVQSHSRGTVVSITQREREPSAEEAPLPNWEDLATTCNYRLGELANLCHVSLRTLQRHFRKHYDTTLSDWMRQLRLDRARAMLAEADSVKFVAFELGYKQPSHFTRDFKQRFGVPPSALRWSLSLKAPLSLANGGN